MQTRLCTVAVIAMFTFPLFASPEHVCRHTCVQIAAELRLLDDLESQGHVAPKGLASTLDHLADTVGDIVCFLKLGALLSSSMLIHCLRRR